MSGGKCPKCGATGDAIWEDNFWSGCNKCGWSASCEHNVVTVPNPSYRPTVDNDSHYEEEDDDEW